MSNPYKIDWNEYAALARQAVAEGCVLLKNDDKALPIRKGERVSVFGRIQFDYYKSGTGSGGAVNTRYVTNILDALKENKDISVNEELEQTYRDWLKDHPFEKGMGWAQEPWCQEEMPVTKELAEQAAAKSDIAVVIIGRTAGEDKDNSAAEGSYLLTAAEHQMLKEVCGAFKRVAVLLNVGNIIDMKWVKEYDPAAVLYVWQGGQEGGAGAADILTGTVTPCGKLSDTIALDISDYPSTEGFGDPTRVIYKEDIYVGYRYFETFAKDCVLYPFGYGLSYTTFTRTVESFDFDGETVTEKVTVKNTGDVQGKEVVTVFVEAPQGKLGKAVRSLAAFAKTETLQPGESETLTLTFPIANLASYDDNGVTGHRFCYVLESGAYNVYTGGCVRGAKLSGSFEVKEDTVTRTCVQACAPVTKFDRIRARTAARIRYGGPQRGGIKACKAVYGRQGHQARRCIRRQSGAGRLCSAAFRRRPHLPYARRGHELSEGHSGHRRRVRRRHGKPRQLRYSHSLLCRRPLRHSYGLRHHRVQPAERHLARLHL